MKDVVFGPSGRLFSCNNENPTQLLLINDAAIMKRDACSCLFVINMKSGENMGGAYVQYVTWPVYIHCTPCRWKNTASRCVVTFLVIFHFLPPTDVSGKFPNIGCSSETALLNYVNKSLQWMCRK